MERWFNVDLSQRPPVNAKKSFDAFEELLKKYPHSQYVADARQRMIFLRNRLADFELYVARYYMRRGAYVGALNRAKFCIENYDGAPAVQGSMKVLVDAYRQLHMVELAANAERVYADNYPGQRQGHTAQEVLVAADPLAFSGCARLTARDAMMVLIPGARGRIESFPRYAQPSIAASLRCIGQYIGRG